VNVFHNAFRGRFVVVDCGETGVVSGSNAVNVTFCICGFFVCSFGGGGAAGSWCGLDRVSEMFRVLFVRVGETD